MKARTFGVPLVLSALLLQGCAGVIVGGVATAGYLAAQERGAKTAVMDTKIKTHIKDRLTSENYRYFKDVEVTVMQGRVLLMGVVDNHAEAQKIAEISRGVPDVVDVYNELFTSGGYSAEQYAKDSWISTQARTKLLSTKDVYSINYMINVVNGRVYVMGIAETQSEMERVLHIIRTIKGVKSVRNFIRYREASGVDSTPASLALPEGEVPE